MITFFIYPTKTVSLFKLNVFESQKLHDILRMSQHRRPKLCGSSLDLSQFQPVQAKN